MNNPKGIDRHTLKLVRNKIKEMTRSLSADEFGQMIGISHSTVRRYLEYPISCNELESEISYGAVGRPERKYRLKNTKE